MKVHQATINFYLRTAKPLSDGSFAIMLRVCYHGYKDISTHYSCPKFYWDSRHQCIKKGFSNAAVINVQLNKLKSSIIAKRDEYIRLGIEYTPSMLLSKDESEEVKLSNMVSDLIDSYYREKELRGSTITAWKYTRELINAYHSGLIISEVDEGWCKRFARWMENERGLSEGVIRTQLGHVACIYRWASSKGLVSIDRYPFRSWVYTRKFRLAEKHLYIHQSSIDVMREYFLSRVINSVNGESFSYIDEGYLDRGNKLFALYFWLLGYLLQGLSPIDICLLKKSDFGVVSVNGEDYWSVDTKRLKTGVGVKIRIKRDTIYSQVMITRMLMYNDGEWFLPILNKLDGADLDKCRNRISSVFGSRVNGWLKEWWKVLNAVIINKNVEEGLNIPLIDEDCTFYSYRHSFAISYMRSGGSPLALATLMGRSVNTLATYVQELSEENDLVDAVSVMQ